jgi:phage shock protein PspC (stress-responsive transcriptional regulator)
MAVDDRLYRSRDDRVIAGVAAGVAEHIDADPSIIRIVWAMLIFLTGGLALLVYIVMAIVVPEQPVGVAAPMPGDPSGAVAPAPTPVPEGGWVAPDGSTVPMAASTSRRARRRQRDPADRARAGLIGGLVLIGLGGMFLIREFIPAFDFDLWWPMMLIGLGVLLLVVALVPTRHSS